MPTTHRMSGTVEYQTWQRIIARCHRESHQDYPAYGATGITVCDRWRSGFESFYEDMGPRPSSKHSIDRYPNRSGNYEPGNCRWATATEQARNKDACLIVTFRGESKSVAEWAEALGWNYHTLMGRLVRRGMDPERAMAEPPTKAVVIEHDGKALTIAQWSALTGIPREAIRSRLNNPKWTVAEALTIPSRQFTGRFSRKKAAEYMAENR